MRLIVLMRLSKEVCATLKDEASVRKTIEDLFNLSFDLTGI